VENKKNVKYREILGLQRVKVVSAEGIESTLKRIFNNIQGNGRHFRRCWYMQGSANGR
jgi:hypothetical protein